jgi:hypothetical protein
VKLKDIYNFIVYSKINGAINKRIKTKCEEKIN